MNLTKNRVRCSCGCDDDHLPPLHAICLETNTKQKVRKNLSFIRSLLKEESINGLSQYGETALLLAAEVGKVEVVQLLIDAGADPSIAAGNGVSPLHRAAYYGHAAIVKTLILAGAPVDSRTIEGDTPLVYAIEGRFHKIEEDLMTAGADLYTVNNKRFTLLHTATYYRNDSMITFLTSNTTLDIAACTVRGDTALHFAASQPDSEKILPLLSTRASLNAKNAQGYTPSQVATHFGHKHIAELLMQLAVHTVS